MSAEDEIRRSVADYYTQKIRQYGPTPRGVDWNSEAGQVLRFDQLLKVADRTPIFSLNEIGCGYGALPDYLGRRGRTFEYFGVDLSAEMIAAAQLQHLQARGIAFSVGSTPDRPRDYCVASGLFNVRLSTPADQWLSYMLRILDVMQEYGTQGFAFNALTRYSDPSKMREHLYYADPLYIFDLCKRRYSQHVALLHDYGLYEFTILVRKNVA